MLEIRMAKIEEYNKVREFYYLLIDMMKDKEYRPAWEKGIYPTEAFLKNAIEEQNLFIGIYNGEFVAAMVMNHDYTEGYEKVNWNVSAQKEEVTVIHILGILPSFQGQGFAKMMVEKAIKVARQARQKVIRLDVLGCNIPAQKLYEKMGFKYIDTIKLFYEDTGLTDFLLYEYEI